MTVAVLFGLFTVLLVVGVPIAFAMGLSAVTVVLFFMNVPLVLLPQRFFSSLDSFPLMAIPLFILAGNLMNVSGITEAIVRFASALIGHIRGGLAQVNIATSLMFSGISGSAAADVAAVGSMLLPAMKKEGYKPEWSAVITAASAILGPILPPSLLMVLYGAMTGLSIGTLFLAGILPGIVIALFLMALTWVKADSIGGKRYPRASKSEVGGAFLAALPAMVLPLLIIGGIQSGFFTATEAGVLAVVYALLYGFVTGKLGPGRAWNHLRDAAVATSSILIILGGAALFSWIIAREGFPAQIADALTTLTQNPYLALGLIVAALLVLGMFVETISALILVTPMLAPIGAAYGIDPIHFAIVTIISVLLGSITPPVAIILILACRIGGVDYAKVMKPFIPYFLIILAGLIVITYVPAVTLSVPRLFGGYGG
ncbi:TRAP transporter large permease [Acuticoccus sp. I52.16.1]|uniref:TRAP transporter large permease n=1 Tax=Acuticoccus sp. I52.16.1 TaxID=2928472 RepID=UPI001FD005A0|nr:TRAP transporter large permease [Acuticoccus sp. I52.16.1]UOM33250.1 TRAP transporter large permease [Acuticoccus sp. I52.16.1]